MPLLSYGSYARNFENHKFLNIHRQWEMSYIGGFQWPTYYHFEIISDDNMPQLNLKLEKRHNYLIMVNDPFLTACVTGR